MEENSGTVYSVDMEITFNLIAKKDECLGKAGAPAQLARKR